MDLRRVRFVVLALGLGLAGPAAAADEEFAGQLEVRTHRVEPGEKVPHGQRRVDQYRKNHDITDRTLEVVVDAKYLMGQSRVKRWTKRITPLDENGRPHGPVGHYAERRGLRQLTPYRHGTRHGLAKHWGGTRGNRHLKAEVPWKNGKIEGKRKTYYPNGELMAVTPYENGKKSGVGKTYDEKGRVQRIVHYEDGQKHGMRKDLWPETGEPRRLIPYKNGQVHGTVKEFYKNGNLKRETAFKDGARHGVEKLYEPDGDLRSKRYWLDNEQVSRQKYEQATGDG